jgi:hypothetical protein
MYYFINKRKGYVIFLNIFKKMFILLGFLSIIYLCYQFVKKDIFKILEKELYAHDLTLDMKTKLSIILRNKKLIFNLSSQKTIEDYARTACRKYQEKKIAKNIRKEANVLMEKIIKLAQNRKVIYGFLAGDYRIATGKSKKLKNNKLRFESLNRIVVGKEIVERIISKQSKTKEEIENVVLGFYFKKSKEKKHLEGRRGIIIRIAKKDFPETLDFDFSALSYSQIKNLIQSLKILKKIDKKILTIFLQKINVNNLLSNNSAFMQLIFLENENKILEKLGLYKIKKSKLEKNIIDDLFLPNDLKVVIVATGKAYSKKDFLIKAIEDLGIKKGNCEFVESTDSRKLQSISKTNKIIIFIQNRNKHNASGILKNVIFVQNLNIEIFKQEVVEGYKQSG